MILQPEDLRQIHPSTERVGHGAGTDRCEPASLHADVWAETKLATGERDILEGVVSCGSCGSCQGQYPVVAGGLLLIEDLTLYLKDHLGVILHLTDSPPSAEITRWLTARAPDDTDPRYVRSRMRFEEQYVNAFLGAHYDPGPLPEDRDNPLIDLLAATASRDLWARCSTLVAQTRPSSALDVGCSVGGLSVMLSRLQSRTLGCDTFFLSVLAARRATLSSPSPLDGYRAYLEGDRCFVTVVGEGGREPGEQAVHLRAADAELRRAVHLPRAVAERGPDTGGVRVADPDSEDGERTPDIVHRHTAHLWTVQELARRVGMSRTAFARRFTHLVGQPPMAYLTWRRLSTAARILHAGDDSLAAVARQVGYTSEFAFANAFKRAFGVAPGRFRQTRRMPRLSETG